MVKKVVADSIDGLIGKDLKGYTISEMTEVYRVNEDGRKIGTVGFFKKSDVAAAFAEAEDEHYLGTGLAFVLTNGTTGFVIGEPEMVKLFDDEAEALRLKEKAIASLSPAQRRLLESA